MTEPLPPHDMDQREKTMQQDVMLVLIAAISLLNGMQASPFLVIFAAGLAPILSAFFITSPVLLFYFASLCAGVSTVILAGIPAALYERFAGGGLTSVTSLTIWLAGSVILAIPTILRFFQAA
jgi:hypothetical protein